MVDVQDGVQQSTNLTVATQTHVAMRYNSQEYSQDLVNFQKLHLEPAMAQLVSIVESRVLQGCTASTYNIVGTPGTPISSLSVTGNARARMNQQLAPKGNRYLQLDSLSMSDMVDAFKDFTNPSGAISEQYREGLIARTSMADFYENERVYNLANAADVTCWISTYTITDPDASLTVSALTAAPTVGMVFEVAGIFDCHPETKQAYTNLKRFVISAAGDTSTLNFEPVIRLTGARKNVCRSDGTDLIVSSLTSAAVTFVGQPSSTYPNPLMYHRDAFTFATAALPLMAGADRCVVKTYDGISLRVWEDSDIRNDEKITRIDILYGFAAIRPQWACRLIGRGT